MPPIRKKKRDRDIVEMAIRAYNYAVSYHAARNDRNEEPAFRKSLHFLESVIYQLRLGPVEQTDGVKPRKRVKTDVRGDVLDLCSPGTLLQMNLAKRVM
jgi:hypothetical protein